MALALCLTLLPTAAMAEDRNTIYTQSTYTGADSDGTKNKPFKTFDAALSKAKGLGGHSTIVILGHTFQNDSTSTSAPLIIDTPVTIEGRTEQDTEGSATFQLWSGGIVLGADVTINNVELNFANRLHNAIFVNGHQFTARNVTRASGTRTVHLFAGGLKGITDATPGSSAVLTLTNSTFGNIHAGSMSQNGHTEAESYNGSTTISLTNCTVGSIYGSGAKAAYVDPNNLLMPEEPDPPTPLADHTVSGPVAISLDGKSTVGTAPTITVNGNGTKDVSVTISNASDNKPLNLPGVSSLTVNGGTAIMSAIDGGAAVTLNDNTTINLYDVASANNAAEIARLSGSGTVAIGKQATLTIGAVEGQHILKTVGSSNIQTTAEFGHSYIIQNSGSGSFALDARSKINPDMELTWDAHGKTWKTPDTTDNPDHVLSLTIGGSKTVEVTKEAINTDGGAAEVRVNFTSTVATASLTAVPLTFMVDGDSQTTKPSNEVDSSAIFTSLNMSLQTNDVSLNGAHGDGFGYIIIEKNGNGEIAARTYNFTVTAPTANSTVSDTFTLTVTDGEGTKPQPIEGIHDLFEPKDSSKQEKFLARVMNRMLYLDQEIDVSDIDISPYEITYTSSAGVPTTGEYAARYLIVENPFHSTVSLQYGSYPEFTYKDNGNVAKVKVKYSTSWNLDLVKRAIAGYDEAMSLIQPNDGDFAKILKLHDWIVKNVSYGMQAGLEGYAVGAFANRSVVCGGYTDCYKFLLDQVGIKNIRVNAMTSTEQHAWNLVLFDGHYFHVDTTWDRGLGPNRSVHHDYFMVNDAEFNKNGTHTDAWKENKNYPQGNTCYIENKFYQDNTGIATNEQIANNPIQIKHKYPANTVFQTSETEHWANCAGGTEIREAHNGSPCTVCGYENKPQPAEKTLSSIAITTPPTKTAYTVGDVFNPAGMVVTANYSDNTTAPVAGFTFEPERTLTTNDTSITVSYTEHGVTKTTTQTITVTPKDPTVAPGAVVTISGAPATAVYGDSFTLTAAAANAGMNGAWTWTSSTPAVLEITGSGSSVTVKVLKASTAPVTITANYVSDGTESSDSASITVSRRAISVKADSKSMTVGGTLPALTVSCGNFASGDTADMVFATQAAASTTADGKTAGSFPITVTAPTLKDGWADKYELGTMESGTLTVRAQSSGGGSSSGGGGGSSSGGGGGGSSSGKTDTTTTTKPDGTKVQTETKKDGSTVKTTTNPNGSSVTETKAADGSTGTVKTDKHGQTTAETTLSSKAIETAKKSGEAVKAPVEVEASRDSSTAPTVKIELPRNSGDTKVEIPVSNVKPGTVAVLVHPDGTEEIVKNSLPTEDGIQLTVNGGATVKIVDNSKDFIDTRNHWAKDAIDFVSARGLVNGMNDSIYAPNASTTRAQLWTILARQNNADLTGGNTWYEKAQLWSKDKGVSDGANPNGTIDRAQMVTMLWRAAGQPTAGGTANFTDVPADSYYANAVSWAIENGITAGVGGGRFDPNSTCTRAQIATFLWRAMAE